MAVLLDFTLNSISPVAVVVIVDYERVEYIYIYSYNLNKLLELLLMDVTIRMVSYCHGHKRLRVPLKLNYVSRITCFVLSFHNSTMTTSCHNNNNNKMRAATATAYKLF